MFDIRDSRYDILFEPVAIGPVTARNRFFQVPHCTGMGFEYPHAHTRMREIKAEGGWAAVCTEICFIHPSSESAPFQSAHLYDDHDERCLAMMNEAVHRHGALGGVELAHLGGLARNIESRIRPLSATNSIPLHHGPVQPRVMDKSDFRELRRWHRNAALRAKRAETDIIYVYAGHDMSVAMHLLSRRHNRRTDEYGGSLENRVRLLRELIEDTVEAVGDRSAVAVRLAVDELSGPDGLTSEGEGREVVEMLAELPDLWDVNVSSWANDSVPSRWGAEALQEPYVAFVKKVTSKPVVGVGWFTSPDTMVSQIKRGVLDFIGAARPSIADPFLPQKIEQGRFDDIRECIGCNICIFGSFDGAPMRCTQNPTMGDEWPRGWHPEVIAPAKSDKKVLVVGAGPAGLEAARALGQRGYAVTLAEASTALGGRINRESSLPGLQAWSRARDWRIGQIGKMAHVETFLDSTMGIADVLEFDAAHVLIATGAHWRSDGVGPSSYDPVSGANSATVITPDDIMAGRRLDGRVVLYDDDGFYMGGVLAERLAADGCRVVLVTPDGKVSPSCEQTLDQHRIQARLIELGIDIITLRQVVAVEPGGVETACIYTGRRASIEADHVVFVTIREPDDGLYRALVEHETATAFHSLERIGDCCSPSTIAVAIHDGHRAARELEEPDLNLDLPYKRPLPMLN